VGNIRGGKAEGPALWRLGGIIPFEGHKKKRRVKKLNRESLPGLVGKGEGTGNEGGEKPKKPSRASSTPWGGANHGEGKKERIHDVPETSSRFPVQKGYSGCHATKARGGVGR